MAFSLRSLFILATCLPSAFAVPTEASQLFQPPVLSEQRSTYRASSGPRPLSRLRDSIIEKIWGSPRRHHKPTCHYSSQVPSAPLNFLTRYGGDVVLRFKVNSAEETKALSDASDILYLDVWESTDEWVDIRIAKDVVPSFLGLLPRSLRQSHTPLMHDLAQAVYETFPSNEESTPTQHPSFTSIHSSQANEGSRDLFFQEYQPLSVIYPWMRLMTSLFPDYVEMVTIGHSHEGRDITGLRVGAQKPGNKEEAKRRDIILISGGSHAREWISTTTVNYIAHSLITRYGKFGGVTKLLDHFDLIFIPTLNPDGYAYTWEVDRLWRKNRQSTPLPFCHGIDLDRAFGYAWDGAATKDNPCSESYAGDGPFQAAEANALATWAKNEKDNNNANFIAFIDLHSYSQQVLYPYSYSCHDLPPSLENLEEVAIAIAKGFRMASGHYYGVSSACEGSAVPNPISTKEQMTVRPKMGLGGGSGLDWFYHDMGVKYAYQVKLRDTGSYGFLLPKANIVPTGQEGFNAVMALGRWLLGNKGIEKNHAEEEVDWEGEMIVNTSAVDDQPHEKVSQIEETEDIITDLDDEEDDFAIGLRRRRRR